MDGDSHFSTPEKGEGVAETEKFIYNKYKSAPADFSPLSRVFARLAGMARLRSRAERRGRAYD